MPDSQGQRPLERAVYGKNIEIAELLLENGANPNQRITSGMTPGRTLLMHAVSVNNPQLVTQEVPAPAAQSTFVPSGRRRSIFPWRCSWRRGRYSAMTGVAARVIAAPKAIASAVPGNHRCFGGLAHVYSLRLNRLM